MCICLPTDCLPRHSLFHCKVIQHTKRGLVYGGCKYFTPNKHFGRPIKTSIGPLGNQHPQCRNPNKGVRGMQKRHSLLLDQRLRVLPGICKSPPSHSESAAFFFTALITITGTHANSPQSTDTPPAMVFRHTLASIRPIQDRVAEQDPRAILPHPPPQQPSQ